MKRGKPLEKRTGLAAKKALVRRAKLNTKSKLAAGVGPTRRMALAASNAVAPWDGEGKRPQAAALRRTGAAGSNKPDGERAALRRTRGLRAKKEIKANPKRLSEASKFHKAVFAMFGSHCALCARPHAAVHAAHVIKRSALGRWRYADPRLARPAHADCHAAQEANRLAFPLAVRIDAVRAHNAVSQAKRIPEPTE